MKKILFLFILLILNFTYIFANTTGAVVDTGTSMTTSTGSVANTGTTILTGNITTNTGSAVNTGTTMLTGSATTNTGSANNTGTNTTGDNIKKVINKINDNSSNNNTNNKTTTSRFAIIEKYLVTKVDKSIKNLNEQLQKLNDNASFLKEEIKLTKKTKDVFQQQLENLTKKEKHLDFLIKNLDTKDKNKFNNLILEKQQLENEKKKLETKIELLTKNLENKEITRQQLDIAIKTNQELKKDIENYKKKEVNNTVKNIFIILSFFVLLLFINVFLSKYLIDNGKTKIETIRQIIISILSIFIIGFIVYKLLILYSQFLILLFLMLSALLILFRQFLLSVLAFFSSIIFKYNIFEYVALVKDDQRINKGEYSFGQIVGMNVFFTKIKIFGKDLNYIGYKTYYNHDFANKVLKLKKGMFYYNKFIFDISNINSDKIKGKVEQIETLLKDNKNIVKEYNLGIDYKEEKQLLNVKIFFRQNNIYDNIKIHDQIKDIFKENKNTLEDLILDD